MPKTTLEWLDFTTKIAAVAIVIFSLYAWLSDSFDDRVIKIVKEEMKKTSSEYENKFTVFDTYLDKIDSGYTYTFNISNDSTIDNFDYRFFADSKSQEIICYITGRDTSIRVGRDITIRIDGVPMKVRGDPFEGSLEDGVDITSNLHRRSNNDIHKIEISEKEGEKSLASVGPRDNYPANLLVLVKNRRLK